MIYWLDCAERYVRGCTSAAAATAAASAPVDPIKNLTVSFDMRVSSRKREKSRFDIVEWKIP